MVSLRTPIFAGTPFDEPPTLAAIGCRSLEFTGNAIELDPGDRLFREGSRATALYYVVRGTVRAEISTDCFDHRVIGYFRRGDVLGFTYSETMLYTATAVNAGRFYCYPADLLLRRFARDPRAAERMTHASISSLARMLALLAIVRSASPTQRIAAYLMSKIDAGELAAIDEPTIEMDIARTDLAVLLGIPAVAIETSLDELAAAGLIRRASRNAIAIRNVDELQALSLNTARAKPAPGGALHDCPSSDVHFNSEP
jgi:CRP/FNR family transcriptional regulator